MKDHVFQLKPTTKAFEIFPFCVYVLFNRNSLLLSLTHVLNMFMEKKKSVPVKKKQKKTLFAVS